MKFTSLTTLYIFSMMLVINDRGLVRSSDLHKMHIDETRNLQIQSTTENKQIYPENHDIETLNTQKRTATGGPVRKVLVFLSMVSFLGNGAFMIFVFWM